MRISPVRNSVIPIIAEAIGLMGGYNIRVVLVIQARSQLREVYGQNAAETILRNLAARVVFGADEYSDAREISEELGTITVKTQSVSKPGFDLFSRAHRPPSVNVSEPTNDPRRRCVCSYRTPPTIFDHGYRNMLYPNVVGQSGTAIPVPVFVTTPPTKIRRNVAAVVTTAKRCGQGCHPDRLSSLRTPATDKSHGLKPIFSAGDPGFRRGRACRRWRHHLRGRVQKDPRPGPVDLLPEKHGQGQDQQCDGKDRVGEEGPELGFDGQDQHRRDAKHQEDSRSQPSLDLHHLLLTGSSLFSHYP